MAITITSEPTPVQPLYNNASIVVLSDLASQYRFKYKFETYVGTTLVNTCTSFPREDGTAIFDASKIVKNYIVDNFDPMLSAYCENFTDEVCTFYVDVSEMVANEIAIRFTDNAMAGGPPGSGVGFLIDAAYGYLFETGNTIRVQQDIPYTNASYNVDNATIMGLVVGATVSIVYTDITPGAPTFPEPGYLYIPASDYTNAKETSELIKGWQAVASWEEAKNLTTFSDLFLPGSTANNVMGSRTNRISISSTDKKIISFAMFNFDSSTVKKVKLVTNSGRTFVKDLGITTDPTRMQVIHFPIGLTELNALTWTSGTGTITEADGGFTVSFLSATNTDLYHPVVVTIKDCNKFENYTICYKSPRGSFWYIPMNLKNTKIVDIVSSNYQHYIPYNYTNLSRGYSTNNLYAKGKITLRTNWMLDNNEITEVMDMVQSPVIYMLKDSIMTPVSVVPGSFEHKNKNQDGLVAFEITFNEDFDKNTMI